LTEFRPRIQLCGRLVVELDGAHREQELPGAKGRMLFAYLVLNRARTLERDELLMAIWGDDASPETEAALRVCLSKVRRAVGPDRISGKSQIRLVLPSNSLIDVEAALTSIHEAESHLALEEWADAFLTCQIGESIAARPFLPGLDMPWIDQWRRRLSDVRVRGLECHAAAALQLGGPALALAERSARAVTELSPFRESAYAVLMDALERQGNPAEALRVFERVRVLLREEMGIAPGPLLQARYRHLLQLGDDSAAGT
jgi:pentatricopeptide repeat protein